MSKKLLDLLPTPRGQDSYERRNMKTIRKIEEKGGDMTLPSLIRLLPTPQAGDWKNKDYDMKTTNLPAMLRGTGKYQEKGVMPMEATVQSQSCLPLASPANLSAKLDEERERQMTATSGLKLLQSLKPSNQAGLLLRMLLASYRWYFPARALEWQAKPLYSAMRMKKSAITRQSADESTQTLDKQGIRQFGLLYQLAPSVRRTNGCGFGLLQDGLLGTPNASDYKGGCVTSNHPSGYNKNLRNDIELLNRAMNQGLLPSPQAMDSVHRSRESYEGIQTRHRKGRQYPPKLADMGYWMEDKGLIPTPLAQDCKDKGASPSQQGKSELSVLIASQAGQKTDMKLQPAFALWMMGFPEGWLDLKDGE